MIIKIIPDKEKASSMLKMAENTEKNVNLIIQNMGLGEHQSLLAREYYEVIRELASAILFVDGFKAVGENAHKETIDYLSKYSDITELEVMEIQDLRIRRNKSSYEGKPIKSPYLENKKDRFEIIINKLKEILKRRLIPFCIIIRGPLGIGKSTIAEMLVKEIDGKHFSIDSILEQEGLDKVDKKEGCIPLDNFIKANQKTLPKIRDSINKNKIAVVDGNFYHKEQIEDLIKNLGEIKSVVFTLKASLQTCIERDKKRKNSYGKQAVEEVYKKVNEFDYGISIDTENKTKEEIASEMKKRLR